MKNITGTKVLHQEYGVGVIKEVSSTQVMTIVFPDIEKRFMYPDAFCKSIQSEDTGIQEEAEAAWMIKKEQKEKAEREEAEREALKRLRKANKSTSVRPKLSAEEIEHKQAELTRILAEIDSNVSFSEQTNRLFIVHQGKTY